MFFFFSLEIYILRTLAILLSLWWHCSTFVTSSLSLVRKGFLGMAMLTSGAGFLSAFSPNYISLLIFRFLVAIGLGGGPVFKSWFLEFVPAQKRGTWMVVHSTFWTFGTMFEASLAWVCSIYISWYLQLLFK